MLDLFSPRVPDNEQHPNFRMLADTKLSAPEQRAIGNWADGFIDRDGNDKFVKELQTTFNSAFWELYLHAAFRELGCTVDYSFHAPDYVLNSSFGHLLAEAVTAAHALGHAPEWERPIDLRAIQDLNREEVLALASIRLSNAVTAKADKYKKSYSSLAHVPDKPFLICVAPFEQPFF